MLLKHFYLCFAISTRVKFLRKIFGFSYSDRLHTDVTRQRCLLKLTSHAKFLAPVSGKILKGKWSVFRPLKFE